MNTYVMSRRFWDWSYANPRLVKPIHSAIYFFAIDHCNRIGWKREYGFPTVMTMEAIGISSYNTYKKGLDDLVEWGFIQMLERSKNQYSSNIIALSFFDEAEYEAPDKALDRAVSKHGTEHGRSTVRRTVSIYKQENKEPENKEPKNTGYSPDFESAWELYQRKGAKKEAYKSWQSLTEEERRLAVKAIPAYLQSKPDIQYRKDFERYLKSGAYEANMIPASASTEHTPVTPKYHREML